MSYGGFKDMAGNEIEEGDFIVYATNYAGSTILRYGFVLERIEKRNNWNDSVQFQLRIRSVGKESPYNPATQWKVQSGGKKVSLYNLHNALVIEDELIPDQVIDLLTGGTH